MKGKKLFLNFLKPLALFIVTGAILLLSDLDKRKGNHSNSSQTKDLSSYKIAYISFANAPTLDRLENGIKSGLSARGLKRDAQYTLDEFNAQGDVSALNTIVGNVQNKDYDLIFTACTPAIQAVSSKIKDVPLVFTAVADGLAAGLGKSTKDHFPNVTGISDLSPHGKTLALIKELMPQCKTVGTLYNPAEGNSVFALGDMKKHAEELGLQLISVPANTQSEIFDAAAVLCTKDIHVVCQVLDNLTASGYSSIIKAANNANIPYVGFDLPQVKDGALLVESKDFYETGKQAADLAIEILNGKSPKDIPFTSGKRILIDFNEDVASKYNVIIPDSIKELRQQNDRTELHKSIRIAFIAFSNSSPVEESEQGIRDVIKEFGWENNVTVDSYNAQSDMAVVSNLIDNIQSKPYDMVISACTPTTQAVAHKVTDKPIVFCTVADPVFSGLGESFEKHPDNITGISVMADFLGTLKMVKEILPNCKKIGSLYNPSESNSEASKAQLEKAAKELGLELVTIPVSSAGEISDATLALLAKDIDAICQIVDNLSATAYSGIMKEVNKTDMPYFTFMTKPVNAGALLGVSRDYYENGRDAMKLAARIIKGESPGDIPFRLVGKTRISLNTSTQSRLGLDIPQDVVKQVSETVE